jgi:hypothetical protein
VFRDALVKVLVIARTGARDEAAWNEVQAIVSKAFDDARRRDTAALRSPVNGEISASNPT